MYLIKVPPSPDIKATTPMLRCWGFFMVVSVQNKIISLSTFYMEIKKTKKGFAEDLIIRRELYSRYCVWQD
jgi:hypothetical protein